MCVGGCLCQATYMYMYKYKSITCVWNNKLNNNKKLNYFAKKLLKNDMRRPSEKLNLKWLKVIIRIYLDWTKKHAPRTTNAQEIFRLRFISERTFRNFEGAANITKSTNRNRAAPPHHQESLTFSASPYTKIKSLNLQSNVYSHSHTHTYVRRFACAIRLVVVELANK